MDTTKAEAIIARFTTDPKLTKQILKNVQDVKDGKVTLDQVIKRHTKNRAMQARIKELIGKSIAGHPPSALTAYWHRDTGKAAKAAETINKHRGAVEHIVHADLSAGGLVTEKRAKRRR